MQFLDIAVIIGLLQAIIVAVLILTNKVFRNESNRQFAYFLFLLGYIGLDSRLSPFYETLDPGWALFFDIIGDDIPWIMILYIPLFRFFLANTNTELFKVPIWFLYIPFIALTIVNVIIDLEMEFGVIKAPFFFQNRILFYQLEDYISGTLFLSLHFFIFFKTLKGNSKWIYRLWWYTTFLLVAWMILVLDSSFFNDLFFQTIEIGLWSAIVVFIYWLMYSGLFQFNLATNRREIREILTSLSPNETQRKSKLSVRSVAYFDQLMELMQINKLYRNPDLGREMLAEQLGISVSYLTQLVKEHSQKNLANFINEFRIEEVKEMLTDPTFNSFDHVSIGLEAGFKSKSAYYSAFRNKTGLTPAEFKRKMS